MSALDIHWVIFLQWRKWVQLGFAASQWCNTSLRTTFNLWRLMHARCLPRSKHPLDTASGIPGKERRVLSKAGVCVVGVEPHACPASAVDAAPWEQLSGPQHLLRMDNLCKQHFLPLLGCDDVSLNCAVATMLPKPRPLGMYTGFPSLHSLLSRVGDVAGSCGTITVNFAELFRLLLLDRYHGRTSAALLM